MIDILCAPCPQPPRLSRRHSYQQDRFLSAPQVSIFFCTDPTGYLQEKQLSLELSQKLIGLRITKDRWYGDCLEYPLINTQGQLCGYERIYARGLLHKRCPDRFSEKDNKKVTRDTRTSKCFAPVGITVAGTISLHGNAPHSRRHGGCRECLSGHQ